MPKDLNSPKGRPPQSVAAVPGDPNCGNGAAALHILQSAANLCGFLVVAVVAPMSGGPSACSKADSPQRLALTELARKAEARRHDAAEPAAMAPQTSADASSQEASLAAATEKRTRTARAPATSRRRAPKT